MIMSMRMSLLLLIIAASCLVVLASIYDIRSWHARRRRGTRTGGNPGWYGLTILVYCRNNQQTIEMCLQHIMDSQLDMYDVVVVDMMSTDGTKRYIRAFHAANPTLPLRLYAKRKWANRDVALREGYQRSQKHERVLVIDGDMTPQLCGPTLATDNQAKPRRLAVVTSPAPQLGALIRYSLSQSLVVVHKALWFWPWRSVIPGTSGYLYESLHFSRSRWTRQRYVYDDRSTIYATPTLTWYARVGARRVWPVIILTATAGWFFLLATVGFVLSATTQQTDLLITCWLLVAGWFVTIIWMDERTNVGDKIAYSFGAVGLYFIWYAASLVVECSALVRGGSHLISSALYRKITKLLYALY